MGTQEKGMHPNTMRITSLIRRLLERLEADGDGSFLRQLEDLLHGSTDQWDRLVAACHGLQIVGFDKYRFPIEECVNSDGLKEVPIKGHFNLEQIKLAHQLVGPGSALSYLATQRSVVDRLILSGCVLVLESQTYIAVYEKRDHTIVLDNIRDLLPTDKLLVR